MTQTIRETQPRPDFETIRREAHVARARFVADALAAIGAALRGRLARLTVANPPRPTALAGGR